MTTAPARILAGAVVIWEQKISVGLFCCPVMVLDVVPQFYKMSHSDLQTQCSV